MAKTTVFVCGGKPKDHVCNSDGPFLYGGDNVPTVDKPELAGKGYTWGSVSCSVCGKLAIHLASWGE